MRIIYYIKNKHKTNHMLPKGTLVSPEGPNYFFVETGAEGLERDNIKLYYSLTF